MKEQLMVDDKTLVALGCSLTFGIFEEELLSQNAIQRCLDRNWATKLGKLANFKKVDNLAVSQGSNARAQRVLVNYLKQNKENLVVIFGITEFSRFETVNIVSELTEYIPERFGEYGYYPQQVNHLRRNPNVVDSRRWKFLEYYFTALQHDDADKEINNRNFLLITALLTSLNIQHYFFPMLCKPESIEQQQLGFKLPIIPFYSDDGKMINAFDWMDSKFVKGSCRHFDHDANQALAEYIYEQIKEEL
jgi:hypothetical protein